jgi:hypothetical protein
MRDHASMTCFDLADYHAMDISHGLALRHDANSAEKLTWAVAGMQADPNRLNQEGGFHRKREELIAEMEARLDTRESLRHLFTIRWAVR